MNDYRKNMEERAMKALSVQPPVSVEEFMKQCDEGKSPATLSKKTASTTENLPAQK